MTQVNPKTALQQIQQKLPTTEKIKSVVVTVAITAITAAGAYFAAAAFGATLPATLVVTVIGGGVGAFLWIAHKRSKENNQQSNQNNSQHAEDTTARLDNSHLTQQQRPQAEDTTARLDNSHLTQQQRPQAEDTSAGLDNSHLTQQQHPQAEDTSAGLDNSHLTQQQHPQAEDTSDDVRQQFAQAQARFNKVSESLGTQLTQLQDGSRNHRIEYDQAEASYAPELSEDLGQKQTKQTATGNSIQLDEFTKTRVNFYRSESARLKENISKFEKEKAQVIANFGPQCLKEKEAYERAKTQLEKTNAAFENELSRNPSSFPPPQIGTALGEAQFDCSETLSNYRYALSLVGYTASSSSQPAMSSSAVQPSASPSSTDLTNKNEKVETRVHQLEEESAKIQEASDKAKADSIKNLADMIDATLPDILNLLKVDDSGEIYSVQGLKDEERKLKEERAKIEELYDNAKADGWEFLADDLYSRLLDIDDDIDYLEDMIKEVENRYKILRSGDLRRYIKPSTSG